MADGRTLGFIASVLGFSSLNHAISRQPLAVGRMAGSFMSNAFTTSRDEPGRSSNFGSVFAILLQSTKTLPS